MALNKLSPFQGGISFSLYWIETNQSKHFIVPEFSLQAEILMSVLCGLWINPVKAEAFS